MKINKLKNTPFAIAEHAFWACLILFIISLIISFLLFYRYDYIAEKQAMEGLSQECVFNREVYDNVLLIWNNQEELFNSIGNKEYINPFLRPVD